jgi:FkbM family methyltransferase
MQPSSRLTPYKHFLRLLADNAGLRAAPQTWLPLFRLIHMPRHIHTSTKLLGRSFSLVDSASFVSTYVEVFAKQIYRFPSPRPDPYIIDGGANIGLSVYYFKRLYPASHVIAFEPDPAIFSVLQENVSKLGLRNVDLHNQALSKQDAPVRFHRLGADAGRLVDENTEAADTIEVPAVPLRDFLHRHIDFLKLDIEGAETTVLSDCADLLCNVDRLFVEYHSFPDRPQDLHILMGVLAQAGFRVHIHPCQTSPNPFMSPSPDTSMDMQLNLFAFREPTDDRSGTVHA